MLNSGESSYENLNSGESSYENLNSGESSYGANCHENSDDKVVAAVRILFHADFPVNHAVPSIGTRPSSATWSADGLNLVLVKLGPAIFQNDGTDVQNVEVDLVPRFRGSNRQRKLGFRFLDFDQVRAGQHPGKNAVSSPAGTPAQPQRLGMQRAAMLN